jgi:hypothetical protein
MPTAVGLMATQTIGMRTVRRRRRMTALLSAIGLAAGVGGVISAFAIALR